MGHLRKLRKEKTSFSPNEEIKDILVVPEQGWGDASPSPAGGEQVPYTGAGGGTPILIYGMCKCLRLLEQQRVTEATGSVPTAHAPDR